MLDQEERNSLGTGLEEVSRDTQVTLSAGMTLTLISLSFYLFVYAQQIEPVAPAVEGLNPWTTTEAPH